MIREYMKILVVEDNPADARLVTLQLQEIQNVIFEVIWADTLAKACSMLEHETVDAILVDLSLPDSQGLDTLRALVSLNLTAATIVFSGIHDEALGISAVHNGAQDYLVKGDVDGRVIARVIRYATERKRNQEALEKARIELEKRVEERTKTLRELNRALKSEIIHRLQAEDEERKIEERYRVLVENVKDYAIYMLDANGVVVSWSNGAAHIHGYLHDEIKGKNFSLFFTEQNIHDGKPKEILMNAAKNTRCEEEVWHVRKNGEKYWAQLVVNVLNDEHGKGAGYSVISRDITDKKSAEELTRKRMLELAHVARLSTMGEMATEIAHELNQPLTAIATYSSACVRLMRAEDHDQKSIVKALETIEGQAHRAAEIIRRLRGFVQKSDGIRELVDINSLIDNVTSLAKIEANWQNTQVLKHLAQDLPLIKVDKILIEQVLLNLIRNAFEAMQEIDEPRRKLIVLTSIMAKEENQKSIRISVSDEGPGLNAGEENQVFERFFTTKAEGMGMGLAICRSIVDDHGGRIWAENNPTHGATFSFELPVN